MELQFMATKWKLSKKIMWYIKISVMKFSLDIDAPSLVNMVSSEKPDA